MSYGRRLLVGIDALACILAIPLERRCRTVVDFWLGLMPSLAFWRSRRKHFWYCRRFLVGIDALVCILDGVVLSLVLIGFDALACILDVLEYLFENDVLE